MRAEESPAGPASAPNEQVDDHPGSTSYQPLKRHFRSRLRESAGHLQSSKDGFVVLGQSALVCRDEHESMEPERLTVDTIGGRGQFFLALRRLRSEHEVRIALTRIAHHRVSVHRYGYAVPHSYSDSLNN
jgi:hypothetical protein